MDAARRLAFPPSRRRSAVPWVSHGRKPFSTGHSLRRILRDVEETAPVTRLTGTKAFGFADWLGNDGSEIGFRTAVHHEIGCSPVNLARRAIPANCSSGAQADRCPAPDLRPSRPWPSRWARS